MRGFRHFASTEVMMGTLAALAAVVVGASALPPPVWPSTWQASFNETSTIIFSANNTGYFWYDAANTRSRTDRNDGSHDRYCAPEKPFQSTACTHLVLGKDRWLVFPQENDCCWCCDASHGCGILTPDWLQRSNASYVGHLDSYRGYPAEEWNAQGLQSNLYYQVAAGSPHAGAPIAINQEPDDVQYFDPSTFSTGSIPDSVFALPSTCSMDKKCGGVCAVVGGRQPEEGKEAGSLRGA